MSLVVEVIISFRDVASPSFIIAGYQLLVLLFYGLLYELNIIKGLLNLSVKIELILIFKKRKKTYFLSLN